jgi:hypothetical protein
MEKIPVLDQMIIFPNTNSPNLKKYVVSGKDIDGTFYAADTDHGENMFKDFWSDTLTPEQKTPAIQGMLNELQRANGHKFRYILPFDEIKIDGICCITDIVEDGIAKYLPVFTSDAVRRGWTIHERGLTWEEAKQRAELKNSENKDQ